MLRRENEILLPVLEKYGIGSIAYCPLEQGILTGKYVNGIPQDSRAVGDSIYFDRKALENNEKVKKLCMLAEERGQTMAQMAIAWALQAGKLTSVILGASKAEQIEENVKALQNFQFMENEYLDIDTILKSS